MSSIEAFVTRLGDMDWGWWPFLYLRPPKAQSMTARNTALAALHFGPISGLLAFGGAMLVGTAPLPAWAVLVGSVAGGIALFFVICRFTLALFWNRRAARLRTGEV